MANTKLVKPIIVQLKKQPERKELPLAQRAKRGAVWFFAVMLAFTFLSRMANDALVPKVRLGGVSTGPIDQSVEGIGKWVAQGVYPVLAAREGLRIGRVGVIAGDSVKAGDELFVYDIGSIEDAIAELDVEIERYCLQIEELNAGRSDSADITSLGVKSAERGIESANEKLENAAQKLVHDKQMAYDDALFEYNKLLAQRDVELTAAQRAVYSAQAMYDEENPSASEQAASQAQEALWQAQANWDIQLAEPHRALVMAEKELRRVQAGTYEPGELQSEIDGVKAAQESLERAEADHKQARDSDKEANARTGYQVNNAELSLQGLEAKRSALMELLEEGGSAKAEEDGTVTEVGLTQGMKVTGNEAIKLAKALSFELSVDIDAAERLTVGDAVSLIIDGKKQPSGLKILSVAPGDGDGVHLVTCSLTNNGDDDIPAYAALGREQSYIIEKTADVSGVRVPIDALRQDGQGAAYVLAVGEEETVLGPQAVAERVDVTLLLRDARFAAVSGSLSAGDRIIAFSERRIEEGDRVEVVDG